MTAEERAQVLVTARLLRTAASIQWLAVGLTITAAARNAIPAIVIGLVALFYGFRVSFDAKLFDDIAAGRLTTSELDTALGALREGKQNRDWIDRCRGARGLVVKAAIATIAQLLAMALSFAQVHP